VVAGVAGAAAVLVEVVVEDVELEVPLPPAEVLFAAVVDVVVVVAAAAGAVVAALVLALGAPEPPQPPTAAPATSAQTSAMFALRVMRPREQI
jgi:hypothetical protein